jgi:hypothetical protein
MPTGDFGRCAADKLAQQDRKQAAGVKKMPLLLGFKIDADLDRVHGAGFAMHVKQERAAQRDALGEPAQREGLAPGERERLPAGAGGKQQRQNAHVDEVRSVDALKGLREHGPHAEIALPLGGPIARGAAAERLAGNNERGNSTGGVDAAGLEDRARPPFRPQRRDAAARAIDHFVEQVGIGERAANRNRMVAAPRGISAEICGLDAVRGKIVGRRTMRPDGPVGGEMVGGDAVAEDRQGANTCDGASVTAPRASSSRGSGAKNVSSDRQG